jgi:hypothetical protein
MDEPRTAADMIRDLKDELPHDYPFEDSYCSRGCNCYRGTHCRYCGVKKVEYGEEQAHKPDCKAMALLREISAYLNAEEELARENEQKPVLSVRRDDDGSTTIEWRRDDRRLAITLEEDPTQSGWHLVGTPESDVGLQDGPLTTGNLPQMMEEFGVFW